MTRLTRCSLLMLAATALLPLPTVPGQDAPAAESAPDWNFWRGPRYNGVAPDSGLVDSLDTKLPTLHWKRADLGGRSTPITLRGLLYTIVRDQRDTPQEGEKLVCVRADTGETVWENRWNVWSSDVPAERVGWSSVVGDPETGNIYALGVCGYFQCLEGRTGKTLWSAPLHEQFGLLSTYGGRTNFPVICEDLVIVSAVVIGWGEMARPAHRFLAFDKRTGAVVWFNGTSPLPEDTTYSSPTVTLLNGQKALVFGSGDGAIWAFQARTGRPIWNYDFSLRGIDTSPVVIGDTVFATHAEENNVGTTMGGLVAINGALRGNISQTGEKWRVFEVTAGKSSPLVVDGRVYVIDDGAKLFVYDAATGQQVGRQISLGTAMRASPLYADGKLYVINNTGAWFILRPDDQQGAEIVARGRFPRNEVVDASPICAHGSLYVQTSGGLYCFRDPEKKPSAAALPPEPSEPPASDDMTPAHVQVVPCELLVYPGATPQFTVRLYNARGQRLPDQAATFAVEGPGSISPAGTLTVPADATHAATIVTAQVGELRGTSRVRIVPALPWEFTFDGLKEPPISWVGARYRHIIRQVDGNPLMVKISTIPKGTRSRCWFGHPELSNYTIELEARGAIANNKVPDIGVIAQGYTMSLMGESNELQLRTWDPQKATWATVPYPWEPNKWYVLKLRVQSDGDREVAQGKVWVRGEPEPDAWTVELKGVAPNGHGSPGLFGNATNAEIFLDNIKVYANP